MARNSSFLPNHEPFAHNDQMHLTHGRVSGPLSFLNPTRAGFTYSPISRADGRAVRGWEDGDTRREGEEGSSIVGRSVGKFEFHWRSRDNRKGTMIRITP